MQFYTNQHKFYCGIDLHARKMYLCVLDQNGETRLHRNIDTDREAFLKAIEPFREDVVIAVLFSFITVSLKRLYAINVTTLETNPIMLPRVFKTAVKSLRALITFCKWSIPFPISGASSSSLSARTFN
jgi:hypothetical protein